jgi:hypothetical protein
MSNCDFLQLVSLPAKLYIMLLKNSKHENKYHVLNYHGNVWKEMVVKKMVKKYMEMLKGSYCKIVTREPGEDRASVITGTLKDIDYKDGFVIIDSEQGVGCLSINTIVAIKPKSKDNYGKYKKSLKK